MKNIGDIVVLGQDHEPFGAELLTEINLPIDQLGGVACINTLPTLVDDATAIGTEGSMGLEFSSGPTLEEVNSIY